MAASVLSSLLSIWNRAQQYYQPRFWTKMVASTQLNQFTWLRVRAQFVLPGSLAGCSFWTGEPKWCRWGQLQALPHTHADIVFANFMIEV
eukprot:COSAG06_NODE_46146_length_349_cov_0.732000_1_plen_89_part_01